MSEQVSEWASKLSKLSKLSKSIKRLNKLINLTGLVVQIIKSIKQNLNVNRQTIKHKQHKHLKSQLNQQGH